MDIFSIFSFAGGLALFLYGMHIMGGALEKQAGGRFKRVLERITSNPLSGVLLGMGVTAIIQSSSATTVMVVGFVNSGIMTLENSVGVIMGANIGTTITAWLLSLVGIESSNFFLQMLKPANFSPLLAVAGIILVMFTKNDRKKDVGQILLGFAVLMFGMETMSSTVKPLADVPAFTNILTMFSNPLLGVLAGALVTGVIQSSSASVGILQAMSMTGSITFGTAIPIILGQHIGTCVTALLSSAGTNANARRAALVHLYFNVISTGVILILFYAVNAFVDLPIMDQAIEPWSIAVVHTLFQTFATALLLPLRKQLLHLACLSVKAPASEEKFQLLDERFLSTPAFAVARCQELTKDMAELSRKTLYDAVALVGNFNEPASKKILEAEAEVDEYEDKLGTYMVKLSSRNMSEPDSRELGELLHCIGDLERISDHAENIMQTAEEMYQKDIHFSRSAEADLRVMRDAVLEILQMAVDAFITGDVALAGRVEPLEQVVDMLKIQLKTRHIARLQRSDCTTMLGFVFSDLITNFERVADHCSNIAICVIQKNHSHSFDAHKYLEEIRTMDNEHFEALHNEYLEKYSLTPNI